MVLQTSNCFISLLTVQIRDVMGITVPFLVNLVCKQACNKTSMKLMSFQTIPITFLQKNSNTPLTLQRCGVVQ